MMYAFFNSTVLYEKMKNKIMKITFISIIFFFVILCYFQDNLNQFSFKENKINTDTTINTDENNIPINPEEIYFPKYKFTGRPDFIDDILKVNSSLLYFFHEPLLFNKYFNSEVYRFTDLRSFFNPMVIRIENSDGNYKLYWKECNRNNSGSERKLILDESKNISKLEWNHFKELIEKSNFWNLPISDPEENLGFDGDCWTIEGISKSTYQVMERRDPTGSFYDCGSYLVKLTNLKIDF